MIILGINAYHGDASAAVVVDGKLVAAVEEERFTRVKHTAGFPANAVRYCLEEAGVSLKEVDHIAIPRNPRARLIRKLFYAAKLPRFAIDRVKALGRFGRIKEELARTFQVDPSDIGASFHRVEHHLAHLASSFFVSPFDKAALLSLDGLGDFASCMWGVGEGGHIRVLGSVAFPHSVGMYYTALTQYLGFWKYGDEYKVMGLAAYGEPEYIDEFRQVLQTNVDMGFTMDLRYFTHHITGPTMTWEAGSPKLGRLFSPYLEERFGPSRERSAGIESRHRSIAATLQKRLEEVVFFLLNRLQAETGLKTLAYAGGIAFNCLANGKIFDRTSFEDLYIQPAAGDGGLAVGAAFYVLHQILGYPRDFVMEHTYWGPEFSKAELSEKLKVKSEELKNQGCMVERIDDEEKLCKRIARYIANGKVVGWYQGRTEWGPRALGNRSIVVDPRRSDMKDILNKRIKHREPFRPFAPSILEEYTGEYFEKSYPSPFMLLTYKVRPEKRDVIPAPTHVDGTGRLQTVSKKINPLYWKLIEEFRKITGVPVVLNTSFNENEPIVNTPDEAVNCFLRTRMDVLAIGNYLVERNL